MKTDELLIQAQRDLDEVGTQLANGELDAETAQRLTATYQTEIERLQATRETEREPELSGRSGGRMALGALLLIGAFAGITWAASGSLIDRDPADSAPPIRATNLDAITNEQMIEVIDANQDIPEVNQMRLALAERYFEDGNYSEALVWFQTVLDTEPTATEQSEALARIGWMILESGDADTALGFVEAALNANPANLEATYFRGLVHWQADRLDDALTDLEKLVGNPDVPADVQALVADAISLIEQDQ